MMIDKVFFNIVFCYDINVFIELFGEVIVLKKNRNSFKICMYIF